MKVQRIFLLGVSLITPVSPKALIIIRWPTESKKSGIPLPVQVHPFLPRFPSTTRWAPPALSLPSHRALFWPFCIFISGCGYSSSLTMHYTTTAWKRRCFCYVVVLNRIIYMIHIHPCLSHQVLYSGKLHMRYEGGISVKLVLQEEQLWLVIRSQSLITIQHG